ncbi:hypothetical protein [Jiangella anatolica]|nr:hypothetical protein [Jiangella anatolica]
MRATLGLAASVVLLAGCADDASPATDWADGVCSAWDQLSSDLRALTSGLDGDLSGRLDAVQASAQDLVDAIADTPDGADEAVEDAQQELSGEAGDVRSGLDSVAQALQGLTDASSQDDVAAALSEAQDGLSATGQALTALGDTVGGYASAADDTLQQAFDEARSCRETRTGGTSS